MHFDSRVQVPIKDAFAAPYEPTSIRTFGSTYWTALVVLFALTFVASIALGVWEFTRPTISSGASSTTVGTKRALNKNDLRVVIEGLEERAQIFEDRLLSPIPLSDPS